LCKQYGKHRRDTFLQHWIPPERWTGAQGYVSKSAQINTENSKKSNYFVSLICYRPRKFGCERRCGIISQPLSAYSPFQSGCATQAALTRPTCSVEGRRQAFNGAAPGGRRPVPVIAQNDRVDDSSR
jgi:hypothetical protein